MTYVDVTLTPEAGYTYVNCRQFYDTVAGALTTKGWTFIESVDAVSGPNTYRRYVWKCPAGLSGLPSDFYVVFEARFVTTTGPVTGWDTVYPLRVWMGETYSAGALGKFATNATNVTLAADLTNPATFTLGTYTVPASIWNQSNTFGTSSTSTSFRFWCLVAKDLIVLSRSGDSAGVTPSPNYLLTVGAYEPVLSAAIDPMPLHISGTTSGATGNPGGGATRAPTFTPGTAYTDVFGTSCATQTGANLQIGHFTGAATYYLVNAQGTLGNAADTNWNKSVGGPMVSRIILIPGMTATSRAAKGVFRGYLKNIYVGNLATHSYGDTFLVNGKVHAGLGLSGLGPLVDTEAV